MLHKLCFPGCSCLRLFSVTPLKCVDTSGGILAGLLAPFWVRFFGMLTEVRGQKIQFCLTRLPCFVFFHVKGVLLDACEGIFRSILNTLTGDSRYSCDPCAGDSITCLRWPSIANYGWHSHVMWSDSRYTCSAHKRHPLIDVQDSKSCSTKKQISCAHRIYSAFKK